MKAPTMQAQMTCTLHNKCNMHMLLGWDESDLIVKIFTLTVSLYGQINHLLWISKLFCCLMMFDPGKFQKFKMVAINVIFFTENSVTCA